jgi:hypothetical protein
MISALQVLVEAASWRGIASWPVQRQEDAPARGGATSRRSGKGGWQLRRLSFCNVSCPERVELSSRAGTSTNQQATERQQALHSSKSSLGM